MFLPRFSYACSLTKVYITDTGNMHCMLRDMQCMFSVPVIYTLALGYVSSILGRTMEYICVCSNIWKHGVNLEGLWNGYFH